MLGLRGDQQLVEQVRLGTSEAAFEAIYERYGGQILSFCRHMLGSREEAEDAVQHTFAAAYTNLLRNNRQINLRPWLYAIARNRCLSILRARREQPSEERDIPTAGLAEEVEHRAELRELLADLRDLPDEQRTALLLAEAGDLSHPEIADVLDCEVPRVKALVFRARSGLMDRRQARETPCDEIREQLANLRGGALRRSEIRHHLKQCPGCASYREDVKSQRRMLAAIIPVTPTVGLKSAVMGAVGMGGGSAGGGIGLGLSAATVSKVAAVAVVAGGGIVATDGLLGGADDRAAGAGGVAGERRGLERVGSDDPGKAGAERGARARERGASGPGRRGGAGNRRGGARRDDSSTKVLGKQQGPAKRQALGQAPGTPGTPGQAAPGRQGTPSKGGDDAAPKPKLKPKTAPNPSPNSKGRGTPETAPPAAPPVRRRGEGVHENPPPGQLQPKPDK